MKTAAERAAKKAALQELQAALAKHTAYATHDHEETLIKHITLRLAAPRAGRRRSAVATVRFYCHPDGHFYVYDDAASSSKTDNDSGENYGGPEALASVVGMLAMVLERGVAQARAWETGETEKEA